MIRLASPRLAFVTLTCLSSLALSSFATAQSPFLTLVGENLDSPSVVTTWPGNPNLLVVAERATGLVRMGNIPFNGSPGPTVPQLVPVLDLSSKAVIGATTLQTGLTGLAFHPRFNDGRQFRYLFVRYNAPDPAGSANVRTIVSRFSVPTGSPQVSLTSEVVLFDELFLSDTNSAHVSGQLHFDPRPFPMSGGVERFNLYFPTGDMMSGPNGVCLDSGLINGGMLRSNRLFKTFNTSVRENAGKILRLNVDMLGGAIVGPVVVDTLGKGLRNPYYFSFDEGNSTSGQGLGDLWVADVGSGYNGEIMLIGVNDLDNNNCYTSTCGDFGWPYIFSGPAALPNGPTVNAQANCWSNSSNPFILPTDLPPATYSAPNYTGGSAIMGGIVYRGTALDQATYEGRYFHGVSAGSNVLVAGKIGSLTDTNQDEILHTPLGMNDPFGPNPFVNGGGPDYFFAGINETGDGEVLLIRLGGSSNSFKNGTIYRIDQ